MYLTPPHVGTSIKDVFVTVHKGKTNRHYVPSILMLYFSLLKPFYFRAYYLLTKHGRKEKAIQNGYILVGSTLNMSRY